MNIERTKLPGVVIITPDVFEDNRGFFMEAVNKYTNFNPVQVNVSESKKGVIRGLHAQLDTAKLIWVIKGSIYDVAYNYTTQQYVGGVLSADNRKQLYVPANFYHGFQALENGTIVCYAMDNYYNADTEHGINPKRVKEWPLKPRLLSKKDKNAD